MYNFMKTFLLGAILSVATAVNAGQFTETIPHTDSATMKLAGDLNISTGSLPTGATSIQLIGSSGQIKANSLSIPTAISSLTVLGQDASGFSVKTSSSIDIGNGCIKFASGVQCSPGGGGGGGGDAYLGNNQTFTGENTFTDHTTLSGGVTGSSGTFTATGNTQYSLETSSGIKVGAGGINIQSGSIRLPDGSTLTSANSFGGTTVSSLTATATGNTQYSIETSSGIKIDAGGVRYPDGSTQYSAVTVNGHVITDEGGVGLTQRPTLNFTGAGVVASDNPGSNRTDVTIGGGGGDANFNFITDNFISQANGTTKVFTLSTTPSSSTAVQMVLNGLVLVMDTDYTYTSPTTITMSTAPASNVTSFFARYTVGTSTNPAAAILTSTQTFSGQNTITNTIYYSSGATAGYVLTAQDTQGTAKWQAASGGTATRGTFVDGDLSSGILTVTHNKGLSAPYMVIVKIFRNTGVEVIPGAVTGATNTFAVDMSAYQPLTGTWGYIVFY